MKTLSIVVTTPPYSPLTATAIDYINHAIQLGVTVTGVFFYQDGVLNASQHLSIPNDEYQSHSKWQQLNEVHGVALHVCITASEKRGLTDELSTENANQSTISENFTVSGLGELVELSTMSQRMVQF